MKDVQEQLNREKNEATAKAFREKRDARSKRFIEKTLPELKSRYEVETVNAPYLFKVNGTPAGDLYIFPKSDIIKRLNTGEWVNGATKWLRNSRVL